jgi:ketosteroid isomerase-like protein
MYTRNKLFSVKVILFSLLAIHFTSGLFAQSAAPDPSVLITADKSFSEFSLKNGFANAFMAYADDNAIKMVNNGHPIIGKQELINRFTKIAASNHNVLTWTPTKAEIAQSGELGYTFGNYELKAKLETGKDTTYFGNYVSIWKRQKDGSWKYVLDGGNATPAP